ncbi:MAG: hypothetical protein ACKVPX_03430 [Myxococcaceae bacterium]
MMKAPVLCTAVAMLAMAGCGGNNRSYKTLPLGVAIDLTAGAQDPSFIQAIQLAEKQVNQAIDNGDDSWDVKFRWYYGDSKNTPALSVEKATDLVRTFGARGLITDSSGSATAVVALEYDADETNDLLVPSICGSCTGAAINNPAATNANAVTELALRNGERWQFRTIMQATAQSRITAQTAVARGDVNGDGNIKFAIYTGSDPGFSVATGNEIRCFIQGAPNFGGTGPAACNNAPNNPYGAGFASSARIEMLTHVFNANPDTQPWSTHINQLTNNINESNSNVVDGVPDAIIMITFASQYAGFVNTYVTLGGTVPLLLFHAFRFPQLLQALGSKAEGQEGISQVRLSSTASGTAFDRAFLDEYGFEAPFRASTYYDAAVVTMLGALKATNDLGFEAATGAAIRDRMPSIAQPGGDIIEASVEGYGHALEHILMGDPIDYDGASGPVDIDANQNVLNRLAQYQVRNRNFVEVAQFDCLANPITCPQL